MLQPAHAEQVTLGGNKYSVWGTNHYDAGPATVNIWVGDGVPLHTTPEPGTFALAAISLVPLGLRRLRQFHKSETGSR